MMYIVVRMRSLAMARSIIAGNLKFDRPKLHSGFGYLAVLFIVMLLAIAMGATYEQIDTLVKREKEQELLFAGKQYQQALASYYHQSPGGLKELPASLDDLLLDKRFISTKRHLRKRFLDPITGGDWGLIKNENDQIKGVYSTSNAQVLQTARLLNNNTSDTGLVQKYSDIKFEFIPSEQQGNIDADQEDISMRNIVTGDSLLE